MTRAWLFDGRAFARKVTGANKSTSYEITDIGPTRECPNCHYNIDNSDVSNEWPGLPFGVKFEPSDADLIQHLAAKCGVGNLQPHVFLNEFIPTLDGDFGINYTHPEKLPGAKMDGSSIHFFHRTMNAYASGHRKRRKINCQSSMHFRWHKTGKTKPIMVNGVRSGWKKIMVLYTTLKKEKPIKANWVMHQLHLGTEEDEQQEDYVVSKILYQITKSDKPEESLISEDPNKSDPRTPNTYSPNSPRPGNLPVRYDNVINNYSSSGLEEEVTSHGTEHVVGFNDDIGYSEWLAGESQPPESLGFLYYPDISLMCKENINSPLSNTLIRSDKKITCTGFACNPNQVTGNWAMTNCISELMNIETDSPPDFNLANLQFGSSEDSVF